MAITIVEGIGCPHPVVNDSVRESGSDTGVRLVS